MFSDWKKKNKKQKNKQNRKPKREKPWIMQLSGYQQIFPDTEIYTKASIIERLYLYYSTMNGEMEQWGKKTESSGEEKPKYIQNFNTDLPHLTMGFLILTTPW